MSNWDNGERPETFLGGQVHQRFALQSIPTASFAYEVSNQTDHQQDDANSDQPSDVIKYVEPHQKPNHQYDDPNPYPTVPQNIHRPLPSSNLKSSEPKSNMPHQPENVRPQAWILQISALHVITRMSSSPALACYGGAPKDSTVPLVSREGEERPRRCLPASYILERPVPATGWKE